MQNLKQEEIMLELELIRTRRDRLLPLCPNCSSQTMAVYQTSQSQPSQSSNQSQNHSPQQYTQHQHTPVINQIQNQSLLQSIYQQQNAQLNQLSSSPHNQTLLSIAIPQQSLSPYQAHLQHQFQVITLPGKQSVTVECQTSPNEIMPNLAASKRIETQSIQAVKKISAFTQTNELVKKLENKEINTDIKLTRNQAVTVNLIAENVPPPKHFEEKVMMKV